jgi:hypothetical protein
VSHNYVDEPHFNKNGPWIKLEKIIGVKMAPDKFEKSMQLFPDG